MYKRHRFQANEWEAKTARARQWQWQVYLSYMGAGFTALQPSVQLLALKELFLSGISSHTPGMLKAEWCHL